MPHRLFVVRAHTTFSAGNHRSTLVKLLAKHTRSLQPLRLSPSLTHAKVESCFIQPWFLHPFTCLNVLKLDKTINIALLSPSVKFDVKRSFRKADITFQNAQSGFEPNGFPGFCLAHLLRAARVHRTQN